MPQDATPNGDACAPEWKGPGTKVAEMQTKLHRWAVADPGRRFDDLFVRHEALRDRVGVKDLHRGLVAARPRS